MLSVPNGLHSILITFCSVSAILPGLRRKLLVLVECLTLAVGLGMSRKPIKFDPDDRLIPTALIIDSRPCSGGD